MPEKRHLKASCELPNGTKVTIEGDPSDVEALLRAINDLTLSVKYEAKSFLTPKDREKMTPVTKPPAPIKQEFDVDALVTLIRDHESYEQFEANIIKQRSQFDRALLPLYVLYQKVNRKRP